MKNSHLIMLGSLALLAGWVACNLTQGGSAFQMPNSGQWFKAQSS